MKKILLVLLTTGLLACEKDEVEPLTTQSNYFTELELYLNTFQDVQSAGEVNEIFWMKWNCPVDCHQQVPGDTVVSVANGIYFKISEPFDRTIDSMKVYDANNNTPYYIYKNKVSGNLNF